MESVESQVRSFCELHAIGASCEIILKYIFSNQIFAIVGDLLAYQSLRERIQESLPSTQPLPTNHRYQSNSSLSRLLTPVATVNSFDIFDTILARRVFEPNDIFSLVEEQFPCPNFRSVRQFAASLTVQSFDDIYDTIQRITLADVSYVQSLKEFEFAMELNHSYLIQQNYDLVKDGDILISDMYLPYDRIWTLLKNAGFNKSVNLFVSPIGKAIGWMWESISALYDIKTHLGDNYHSDVVMALAHNVHGEHSTIHVFSTLEKRFHSRGKTGSSLAFLIRRMRHRNPYPINSIYSTLFNGQIGVNLPALLLIAQDVYDMMLAEGLTRLLLTMRDCCLLEKIFHTFYPEIHALSFHTSRIMFENPTEEFRKYVTKLYAPGETLILDMNGAFRTGRRYFELFHGYLPRVHVVTFNPISAAPYGGLTFSLEYDMVVEIAGLITEFLNADIKGSLIDVFKVSRFRGYDTGHSNLEEVGEEVIFARLPMRYRAADVLVYHRAIDLFCATADKQYVRELLQSVAVETIDNGGRLSAALLSDCMREMISTSSLERFYRGKDFIDHSTLQVTFNVESNRSSSSDGSSSGGSGSSSSSSGSSGVGGRSSSSSGGSSLYNQHSYTSENVYWSWFAYVDIIAAEWSAHGQSESNLRGMQLLLLEQGSDSTRPFLYPVFQTITAALLSYFGNLLRQINSLHELQGASDDYQELLVLHASWINNSTADFPYGLPDGEFTGPTIYNSLRGVNWTSIAAASIGSGSSSNSSRLFPVVLEVLKDCTTSWKRVLAQHNNLRIMNNILPEQESYLYIIHRSGCSNHISDLTNGTIVVSGKYEVSEVNNGSSLMTDTHLLRDLLTTCYYCPSFTSEEVLWRYSISGKVNSGSSDRGLCNSNNWRLVSPYSSQWTVCSFSPYSHLKKI